MGIENDILLFAPYDRKEYPLSNGPMGVAPLDAIGPQATSRNT